MRIKRHKLIVEIECDDAQGSRQAQDRLIRWIETFGHTAPSFGFDFFNVGRIAGLHILHMKGRIEGPKP